MLLAGPSQPATYPTSSHNYSPAVSRLTISSSSTVSKSNESARSPSSSTRFSFMKSISSQLNRGTELLKQTVQRAIFSKITVVEPPLTVKPTPYHSDPHAVTRSSSVDSLHLETCYMRPIRPYNLTQLRRSFSTGQMVIASPAVRRPPEAVLEKGFTLKVKARFKLQKGNQKSAFSSLGKEVDEDLQKFSTPSKETIKSPSKRKRKGRKRKRSSVDEDTVSVEVEPDLPVEQLNGTKKIRKSVRGQTSEALENEEIKGKTKKATKRKSQEQERQEREDFELAKKLQKEFDLTRNSNGIAGPNGLNASTGSLTRRTARNGRSLNDSTTTTYSLRNTRSLSKISGSTSPMPVAKEKKALRNMKGANEELKPIRNGKNGVKQIKNVTTKSRGSAVRGTSRSTK